MSCQVLVTSLRHPKPSFEQLDATGPRSFRREREKDRARPASDHRSLKSLGHPTVSSVDDPYSPERACGAAEQAAEKCCLLEKRRAPWAKAGPIFSDLGYA
jgi:hypothetical protein